MHHWNKIPRFKNGASVKHIIPIPKTISKKEVFTVPFCTHTLCVIVCCLLLVFSVKLFRKFYSNQDIKKPNITFLKKCKRFLFRNIHHRIPYIIFTCLIRVLGPNLTLKTTNNWYARKCASLRYRASCLCQLVL